MWSLVQALHGAGAAGIYVRETHPAGSRQGESQQADAVKRNRDMQRQKVTAA